MKAYSDLNLGESLYIERLQFPLVGQQLPPTTALVLSNDREVHLFKYTEEVMIYGVPTYHMKALRLA